MGSDEKYIDVSCNFRGAKDHGKNHIKVRPLLVGYYFPNHLLKQGGRRPRRARLEFADESFDAGFGV